MDLLALTRDNITELLLKIIEFTQIRQKTLSQNIYNFNTPDFAPQDLPVREFSDTINQALIEHLENRRLVLRDSDNIRFSENGMMELKPVVDENAKVLFQNDRDEYLELQLNKLVENSLNQRVAAELLSQKQGLTWHVTEAGCNEGTTKQL
jgi:flagellar basal body rod protein FlgB